MTKLYGYSGCDSCRRAKAWLQSSGVAFEELPIRETPPERGALRRALETHGGQLRKLFNTAGQDYRAMGMKERLPGLGVEAALDLLAVNGNLVKRPFLVTERGCVAGFSEELWSLLLN